MSIEPAIIPPELLLKIQQVQYGYGLTFEQAEDFVQYALLFP